MINKLSLKFKDRDLESLYQTFLLEKIQYPVFMVLAIFSIMILGIKNIDGFINNNQSQFTLKLIGFCLFVVVSIISFCYKKFTRIAFYVINHFLMLYQINQRENVVQHTYLFGQNQMFVHSVVMLVSDYPDGIITNFTWTVIRMTIANTLDTKLDYQDQIYSIAVFFCLCLCIYIKNVHLRKAYMFSIRDSSWEVLLPQLISKPTFIFTCNEEKQQFQISRMIQMHFLMNVENPLLHFLRNTRLGNKTLEQYIWDKAKQRSNSTIRYTIENLTVYYNKKQQQITFSECLLDTVTFILVIDSEDKSFIELRKKQQSIQEQHTNQILKVFKSQQSIIKRGLKEKSFDLIFDLSIAIVQMIQRCQLNKSCLRLVNLTNLLDYIIKQFQQKEGSEYDFSCNQNILILTIQPLLVSYLLYLFQNMRQFNHIRVELSRINGQIQLQILGQLQKQMDSFYEQVEKILIKKKIIIQSCKNVCNNQVQYFYLMNLQCCPLIQQLYHRNLFEEVIHYFMCLFNNISNFRDLIQIQEYYIVVMHSKSINREYSLFMKQKRKINNQMRNSVSINEKCIRRHNPFCKSFYDGMNSFKPKQSANLKLNKYTKLKKNRRNF